jgi:SAM-dependent methyltransferase
VSLDSAEYYRQISSDYTSVSKLRGTYNQSINGLIKPLVDQILSRNGRWLDVGSGDGKRILDLCGGSKPDLTSVEPVMEFVAQIKKNLPFANIFHGTLGEFRNSVRSKGHKFELISCLWNVVGHTSDPKSFFLDLADLLSNEGTLVLDVNNRLNVSQYGFKNVARNIWRAVLGDDWTRFLFPTPSPTGSSTTLTLLSSPGEIETFLKEADLVVQRRFFVSYRDGKVYSSGWWKGQMYIEVKRKPKTPISSFLGPSK